MKHTLKFLYKIVLVCLVATTVFVLPATIATMIWLDKAIYMTMVESPMYCAMMGVFTLGFTISYVDYMITKSKSNADTCK